MTFCEKCWADAHLRMMVRADGRSQADHYQELLKEHKHRPSNEESVTVPDNRMVTHEMLTKR